MNPVFVDLLATRLQDGGQILVQTDVASLLEEILESLEAHENLVNVNGLGRLCPRKPTQASSHREKRCQQEGIPIFRALVQKTDKNRESLTA